LSSSSNIASSSSSSIVSNLEFGTRFEPEMLGLAPGKTTASLNLNWISTSASSVGGNQAKVRLLNADGGLIETFDGTAANAATGKRHHKVTITDLNPSTSYKYSVSNNGSDWSYEYNYKTPQAGNVFKFAAIADPQITDGEQDSNTNPKSDPSTTAQGWKETVERIAATGVSLIVSAGDQVDSYTYTASQYEKFFAPEALRSIAFAPAIGNHDTHNNFFHHFNMPNLMSASTNIYTAGAGNYYYLYNNILFVVLNTGIDPTSSYSPSAASLVTAYDNAIKAAKTAHSSYDWIIVIHHKSTMSISSHACDVELEEYVKAGLEKIMTDNGIDLVIGGHDHIYVRSHLMKWNNSKGYSERSADKGTIYLTLTTASGVKFYPSFWVSTDYSEASETYPMLADLTKGATEFAKARVNNGISTNKDKWPLSTDFYVQGSSSNSWLPNYTPNYTIFDVSGASMKVTTRTTATDAIVDEFTITPKGR
jgi:hypothetical protein